LFAPGFYVFDTAIPIPKIIAAPLYFIVCIATAYGMFLLIERGYARFAAWRGKPLSKARLRHHMLTVCAFLTFNLFYVFAGSPQHPLDAALGRQTNRRVDRVCLGRGVARSLSRDRRYLSPRKVGPQSARPAGAHGVSLRRSPRRRSIDQLSADEIYVLAKTLPNFTVAQKREAYEQSSPKLWRAAILNLPRASGCLSDVREQLGLTDADHHAITEAVGVQDPALLDPESPRIVSNFRCAAIITADF